MSEQKHTRAPWHVFDNREDKDFDRYDAARIGVGSDRFVDVAHCYGFSSSRSDDEVLANAHLIAAAPDLLEALRRMDRMHELMMSMTNHRASWYDANTLREMNEAPIQAARALAKATGDVEPSFDETEASQQSAQAARERSVR